MAHRAKHLPAQLSGGQQQRVAVARAVAGEPAILLADEPTGNLDSKNGESIMKLLQELHAQGATICMVTHDARFVGQAQRSIELFDGRLAEADPLPLVAPTYDVPTFPGSARGAIQHSATTAIVIGGGAATSDRLNLDFTPSYSNPDATAVLGTLGGVAQTTGYQNLSYTGIEVINVIDNSLLTRVLMGDIFVRGTENADTIQFGATAMLVRPEYPTMTIAISRFLTQPGGLNYGQAMAMATILLTVCAGAIILIERIRIPGADAF